MMLPQELEVWYVIPAIRKELSKNLTAFGLKQKEVALLFGVSEACVSNYFKSKRAGDVTFNKEMKSLIHESALRLSKGKSCFIKEVQWLCKAFKKGEHLCSLHKRFENKMCDYRGCLI